MRSKEESHFLFSLGKHKYAVPLLSVREVAVMGEIAPVPFMPPFFLGVMNLRGQVISVIDLRLRLGMSVSRDYGNENLMIVFQNGAQLLGAVVDSVEKVVHLDRAQAQPFAGGSPWVTGVLPQTNGEVVLLLDEKRAVTNLALTATEDAA